MVVWDVSKIKVIYKPVNGSPELKEINGELAEVQELVGGYIEVVPLPEGVQLILNEEG